MKLATLLKLVLLGIAGTLVSSPAAAQTEPSPILVVAVPPLATPSVTETAAGSTWAIANQMAEVIAKDLEWSQRFVTTDVKSLRPPSYPEITAPAWSTWRGAGARALVSGFVQARADGRLTVGCYLYDVQRERELARKGFLISPADWRKAAHRCADAVYAKVTGEPGLFETRVAYVDESGPATARLKRIAVQDLDVRNHKFLTSGDAPVITPRWSPDAKRLAYTSLAGGQMQVRLIDIASGDDRPVIPDGRMTFAPAFSPDGRQLLFSIASGGNTDVQLMDLASGAVRRLTDTPGADTSANFSPDGERIVFESDRSGSQQIYVMNADGSDQRRISFGGGAYGSPRWSPDGQVIAFTKIDGLSRRIGVMEPNGANMRVLTSGTADESPSWGPSGRHLLFQRRDPTTGRTGLFMVALSGGTVSTVTTPQEGSDPAWSALQE